MRKQNNKFGRRKKVQAIAHQRNQSFPKCGPINHAFSSQDEENCDVPFTEIFV